MIFAQKVLAPGPGTQPRVTFRWRPFQSALSGSLFFKPPALPEAVTLLPFAMHQAFCVLPHEVLVDCVRRLPPGAHGQDDRG
jgi:hypothetical protein